LNYSTKDLIFDTALSQIPGMLVTSSAETPIIHLRFARPPTNRYENEVLLQRIVDEALQNGVLLTRAKYVEGEEFPPVPSIRISVSAANTRKQLEDALRVIRAAVANVIGVPEVQKIETPKVEIPATKTGSNEPNTNGGAKKKKKNK
jgi:hypothetical protein